MSIYPMNITKPLGANDLEVLNQNKGIVLNSDNVDILNTSYYKKKGSVAQNTAQAHVTAASPNTGQAQSSAQGVNVKHITLPALTKRVSKGQKVPLNFSSKDMKINFGWNVNNPACDVDVSAFLLSGSGKVVGDDYFVFYGQESSPEKSVLFKNVENANVLEVFDIDT